MQCAHASTRSNAPLNVFYVANTRKIFNLQPPFLHNTVCMLSTPPLPAQSIPELSLGEVALHIRETVHAQTSRDAVELYIRWRITNSNKPTVFFEPWRGKWNVVTNWREMELMDVDFSGALPDTATGNVKCVYPWVHGIPEDLRDTIGIWADDPTGGMWCTGFFDKQVWEDKRGFGQFKGR